MSRLNATKQDQPKAIDQSNLPVQRTFSSFLVQDTIRKKINEIIGGENGQRFMSQIMSAVSTNTALQACEPYTILNCGFLSEALKLPPSPQLGYVYFVPFKSKDGKSVATFQIGYRGYIQLAMRSGTYKKLNVISIKESELVSYNILTEELNVNIIQDDLKRDSLPTIGYYAMFEYNNGFTKSLYWSKKKMEAHAVRYSQGYASDKKTGKTYTFWSKDFDSMAYKTMLRQLLSKWGMLSVDMIQAYQNDMTFQHEDKSPEYIGNEDDQLKPEENTINLNVVPESDSNIDSEFPDDPEF